MNYKPVTIRILEDMQAYKLFKMHTHLKLKGGLSNIITVLQTSAMKTSGLLFKFGLMLIFR